MISEKDIEQRLKKKVEQQGALCLKFVSPGTSGVPDRLILLKRGGSFFVECKRPGENLRPLQRKMKSKFEKLGHTVEVVSTFEEVDALVRLYWGV
ncbi:MAG: VRR-NUC domain-containing protein [Carnobacterium sp.]|uniref:VRR-NUC domain-containing protein n=1 Tax=Carnobacterium sp. TaxID=48221 RepID=UPI002FCB3CE5